MGWEIERRFLVVGTPWTSWPGQAFVQGYLARTEGVAVRVRRTPTGSWLTVKGPSEGAVRPEFEWPVPDDEAEGLLALCGDRVVHKTRHEIPVGDHTWEVDVFAGTNAGLVIAEVELDAEDEAFERPAWAGVEITDDHRYANVALAERPWSTWGRSD